MCDKDRPVSGIESEGDSTGTPGSIGHRTNLGVR